jgi:hypothetical protein
MGLKDTLHLMSLCGVTLTKLKFTHSGREEHVAIPKYSHTKWQNSIDNKLFIWFVDIFFLINKNKTFLRILPYSGWFFGKKIKLYISRKKNHKVSTSCEQNPFCYRTISIQKLKLVSEGTRYDLYYTLTISSENSLGLKLAQVHYYLVLNFIK